MSTVEPGSSRRESILTNPYFWAAFAWVATFLFLIILGV